MGLNSEISQRPPFSTMVTMTLLVASAGEGRSLLVVTWLTKMSTCALPGSIWETAARATLASVLTPVG